MFLNIEVRFVVTEAIDGIPGFAGIGADNLLAQGGRDIAEKKVEGEPAHIVEMLAVALGVGRFDP
jgi:hypothetical protein